MKKTLSTILSVLFCAITFAQSVPQGINYQAVARDANGDVLMNQALTIQFSVISDIATSAVSWQETHTVSTNDYGLYTAIIGGGTATNVGSSVTFDVIDWGASNHLLKVEVDFGSGYLDMGTTAFMSVPYAINSTPQSLTISGDTLFISSGNSIVIPGLSLINSLIVQGCTDITAFNYNVSANTDDGSCIAVVLGCTDSTAYSGYNPLANTDDGSCIPVVLGCTNSTALNYDPLANTDDGSCIAVVNGCTDATAPNYDPLANTDDGSCIPVVLGCADSTAFNYNVSANTDDGSCIAVVNGCTDATAPNYDPLANTDDGSCCLLDEVTLTMTDSYGDGWNGGTLTIDGVTYDQPTTGPANTSDTYTLCVDLSTCIAVIYLAGSWSSENSWSISDASGTVLASAGNVSGQFGTCILGCTDLTAFNYNALANSDDGSCIAVVNGCTDATAFNYDPLANTDDGSCIIYGCTDSTAYSGYNPLANTDDGSCIPVVNGCTDATAFNYDPLANTDDGSCIIYGCTDSTAFNYNANANTDDGSCIAVVLGCTDAAAPNYDPLANTDDGSCIAIGSTYQGGIVFWLDGNGGGLIAAPTDQSYGAEWGCFGTTISGADGTAIGTGNQNTIDIEAGCTNSGTAADICANLTLGGYSDWFLPSKDELNEMYLNIGQGLAGTSANVGGFAYTNYWSSTEDGNYYAWMQMFNFGIDQSSHMKYYNANVRAVRVF